MPGDVVIVEDGDFNAPPISESLIRPGSRLSLDEVFAFPGDFERARVRLSPVRVVDAIAAVDSEYVELQIIDLVSGRPSRPIFTPFSKTDNRTMYFAIATRSMKGLIPMTATGRPLALTFSIKSVTDEHNSWVGILTNGEYADAQSEGDEV